LLHKKDLKQSFLTNNLRKDYYS